MTDKQQIYYHFVSANMRLRYDLADVEVHVGLHLKTDQEIELCDYGYHASKTAMDALKYAPADAEWLCGVTLGGSIIHDDDKSVASERTVVWMLNVRKVLVEFALWNAERAFEAVRSLNLELDHRSIEAIRVVRLWLVDKANNEEVRAAARTAAYAAAVAAYADARTAYAAAAVAADVAYAAADAAARTADAAYADAAAAAADAAAAARTAADAAARKAQSAKLEELIAAARKVQGE